MFLYALCNFHYFKIFAIYFLLKLFLILESICTYIFITFSKCIILFEKSVYSLLAGYKFNVIYRLHTTYNSNIYIFTCFLLITHVKISYYVTAIP